MPAGAEGADRLAPGNDEGDAVASAAHVHGPGADQSREARDQDSGPGAAFSRRAIFSIVSSVMELNVARAVASISASTWSTARSSSRRGARGGLAPTVSKIAITSSSVRRFALPLKR